MEEIADGVQELELIRESLGGLDLDERVAGESCELAEVGVGNIRDRGARRAEDDEEVPAHGHERGVLDKSHFAHAFARALDTLAPEHRGGMIEHVLQNLRDRCMNLPARGSSDARQWLDEILRRSTSP